MMAQRHRVDPDHWSHQSATRGSACSLTEKTLLCDPMLLFLLRHPRVAMALRRAAQAGSIYGLLWLAVGGWYEYPWELPGVTLRLLYTTAVTITEYIARGWRPLFEEWTLGFEIARAVSRAFVGNYGHRIGIARNAQIIRKQTEITGTIAGFFACYQHGTSTESLWFNELEHMWVRSAAGRSPTALRLVVLFFHGGGYAVNSPRMYIPFGSELQHRLRNCLCRVTFPHEDVQVEVLLANYRKTPEHRHPIPPLDALAMYKYLIDVEQLRPQQIIVAGDSAGASLAIATMLRLRDSNQRELLPLAGILSCPFVDLETTGDERKVPHCILSDRVGQAVLETYHPRDGDPSSWGDASPVHCDLSGLPPVYIQAAELDYILPHALRLAQKARDDGVDDWELEVFSNVPHVFTNFPPFVLPAATKGLDAMAAYAASKFAAQFERQTDA